LVFVRSVGEADVLSPQLIDQCFAVHDFILSQVQPEAILTFSKHAYGQVKRRAEQVGAEEVEASGHGNASHSKCYATEIRLFGRPVKLIRIPHFTYYNPSNYPDALTWLKSKVQSTAS
jgi:hypothetical protein